MEPDRIDWIFNRESSASLEERYDAWAATYDQDHDQWGWLGPDLVAAATVRHLPGSLDEGTILDAGSGTGMVGLALRRAGWSGHLVGLDLSQGMLDQSASLGVYDELVKCSLYDIPYDGHVVASVSSGVFTSGHVGGEALSELCRVTAPGGVIVVTQRLDLAHEFSPHIEELNANGVWVEVERSEPRCFHPKRDESEQVVITWRVQRERPTNARS